MADDLPPPASAGGNVVSEAEPCLTDDGAPTTPRGMPRDPEAIRNAHANHDAERTDSKVRLTASWTARLDRVLKGMGLDKRAHAVYRWIEAEEKKQGIKPPKK